MQDLFDLFSDNDYSRIRNPDDAYDTVSDIDEIDDNDTATVSDLDYIDGLEFSDGDE